MLVCLGWLPGRECGRGDVLAAHPALSAVTRHDVVVVGAGLVGLSTAYALIHRFPGADIVVIDKEHEVAQHQSTHNSGVVHSGLYYAPGSASSRLCRSGRQSLLEFVAAERIPVLLSGKLVVAVRPEETVRLRALAARGAANGLHGLELLDRQGIREHEPAARGLLGLWVPETALLDYRQVALALKRRLRQLDVQFALGRGVTSIREEGSWVRAASATGPVEGRWLVNCAGLQAELLARSAGLETGLRIIAFRGDYYELAPSLAEQVRSTIYPVPDPRQPFLGVHLTRHVGDGVTAGPNAVLALAREGYRRRDVSVGYITSLLGYAGMRRLAGRYVKTALGETWRDLSKRSYARAVAAYFPGVTHRDLMPGPSGVRAQAVAPDGTLLDDFRVIRQGSVVNVLNAPSPAATACLAIGEGIASRVTGLGARLPRSD